MAPLEVISAGMSRVGTVSLCTALDILGYNTIHFKNFSRDETLDLEGFKDAVNNREEADWDKLYENYNAAVDIPTWVWYKDLVKKYPNAKVILTVREPESWYTSMKNLGAILNDPKNQIDSERSVKVKEVRHAFYCAHDSPIYGKMKDKESGMAAFEKHNQDVIDFVPKENLLVMQLGEGWERLCEFLGKPIPDVPYPNLNSPKQLQESITKRIENEKNKIKSLNVGEAK
ncbi:hypothetical protein K501DRAFT_239425 [Backusella circina FSU 941]|nr:hypothetical protein K501DRAFT_239425 [Backusella circina FSU 941]